MEIFILKVLEALSKCNGHANDGAIDLFTWPAIQKRYLKGLA